MKFLFRKKREKERRKIKIKNAIYKEGKEVHEGIDILLQGASSSRVRATGTSTG